MYIPDLQIETIALVPIIVVIVQGLKELKIIKPEWAPWANGLLTVFGYILVVVVQKYPHWTPTVVMVLTIVTIFLSASGLYEFGKNAVQAAKTAMK
ncbi:MAG: hypothetical protein ABIG63_06775 [Chloroflexota bacterium]